MPIPPRRPVTLAVRAARLRALLHLGRPLSRRSPRVRTALVVAFMCLDLAVAGVAAAERSPAADVYFERGVRALRQGEAADAVEDLAEAARLAPGDAAVLSRYAQALLAAGKPKQALAALEQLRELDPEVPDLAFMEGLAQLRLAHWPEAVAQLEVARSEAPDSARVALLLGTAYQESGSVPEAEKEFAEALVLDPTLEPQVRYLRAIAAAERKDRASAHRLFTQLRAEFPGSELARSAAAHAEMLGLGGERRWSAFASVGLEYDSNANFAGEDPALLASRQGDGAAVFQAGIDGTVFMRDPFLVRVGYSGYLSAYQDLHDFDIEANSLFGEAIYKISDLLSLELDYEFDFVAADWSSFLQSHAIEPAVNLQLQGEWLTRPFVRYEDRTFFTDPPTPEQDSDGTVWLFGAVQYWFPSELTRWGRGFLRGGFRYRNEDTKGGEFNSRGWQLLATLGLDLPLDSFFLIEGFWERRRFDQPSSLEPFGGDREDRIAVLWAGLRRPLSANFSLELSWRYTHWSSNVAAYDFDQSVTAFRLWYDY